MGLYSLLELMAQLCRCQYLSDLPTKFPGALTREQVAAIPDEQYTSKEWQEALVYILREPCPQMEVSALKARLNSFVCGAK